MKVLPACRCFLEIVEEHISVYTRKCDNTRPVLLPGKVEKTVVVLLSFIEGCSILMVVIACLLCSRHVFSSFRASSCPIVCHVFRPVGPCSQGWPLSVALHMEARVVFKMSIFFTRSGRDVDDLSRCCFMTTKKCGAPTLTLPRGWPMFRPKKESKL